MLTPNFELKQSAEHVILIVKAPLANVAKTELVVEDFNVFFSSTPYYLRLKLPGQVKENEAESGSYDVDSGTFIFRLVKVIQGEEFEDLDLIGKFLFASKKFQARPKIEVLDGVSSPSNSDSENELDEEFWLSQQPEPLKDARETHGYGFANKTNGNGEVLKAEFYDVIELDDLESTSAVNRGPLRYNNEAKHFCDEHYLADFMEPGEIPTLIEFKAPWDVQNTNEEVSLSSEETKYLKELGNRDYLLNSHEKKIALLSLADIIFSYAYNYRTFTGENTVESAWTINKLSATLSWFQTYGDAKEVKIACMRRSLVYPLYRHFDLSMKVLLDVQKILKLGRRQILKCLIDTHKLFNSSEPRYLLNQLYITDYCVWLQKVSDQRIHSLAQAFELASLTKKDVGFELEELENAANIVLEEELGGVDRMLSTISLGNQSRSSSSDSSSSESSSTEDSDDCSSS